MAVWGAGCARAVFRLFKIAGVAWSDDYAPSMGAALSYYTVFSIAPLILIAISVAGLVFGEDAARGEIVAQLTGLMGRDAASAVQSLLASVNRPTEGRLATAVGTVFVLIGASSVFGELQNAMDRIWHAPRDACSGLWHMLRARLLSFGMILSVGFLLLVSLVVSAALSAIGRWWSPWFEGWGAIAHMIDLAFGFTVMTLAFAVIYKVMPRTHVAWRDVWIGAGVTSLLFAIGKFLIGVYIGNSSVVSAYGAASSLVIVLLWVYYSAQIFLVGAEFTRAYAYLHGSRKNQPFPLADR